MKKRHIIIIALVMALMIGGLVTVKMELKKDIQKAYEELYFSYVASGFLSGFEHFEQEHSAVYFAAFLEGAYETETSIDTLIDCLEKANSFSISNKYGSTIGKAKDLRADVHRIQSCLERYPAISDNKIEIQIAENDGYYDTIVCSINKYRNLESLLQSVDMKIIYNYLDLQMIEEIEARIDDIE